MFFHFEILYIHAVLINNERRIFETSGVRYFLRGLDYFCSLLCSLLFPKKVKSFEFLLHKGIFQQKLSKIRTLMFITFPRNWTIVRYFFLKQD